MLYAASGARFCRQRVDETMSTHDNPVEVLRDDFRHHLDVFYMCLKLAPPYDSVEKAIAQLTSTLKALPAEQLAAITGDPSQRWPFYRQAMVESGLNRKHSGIVAGLIRSKQTSHLPGEYEHFLSTFIS